MRTKTIPSWVAVERVENVLRDRDTSMTLIEIMHDTELNKPRAYRAIVKLIDRGVIEKLYGHKYAIKKV